MALKPAFLTSSSVASCSFGAFQEPSSGTASKVFPTFHPGFATFTHSAAERAVQVPGHASRHCFCGVFLRTGFQVTSTTLDVDTRAMVARTNTASTTINMNLIVLAAAEYRCLFGFVAVKTHDGRVCMDMFRFQRSCSQ